MNSHLENPERELSREQKEALKLKLSQYIEEKLRIAAEQYIPSKVKGEGRDIVEFLLENWPENDGAPVIRRPVFKVGDHTVRFESEATDYDSTHKRFSFGLKKLRQAETEEVIRQELDDLIDSVYHEVEHTESEGVELEGETVEGMVKYLCNVGEIEAYGRQFARRYAHTFPGEDFNMANVEKLASESKSKSDGARNLYHYISVFARPEKIEEFSKFGDVAAAREAVIEATRRHLAFLK